MAYLFDPKTIMPPKKETVAATSGGGGSGDDQSKQPKQEEQIPNPETLPVLKRRRGTAKSAFTRALTQLQDLHEDENLMDLSYQVEEQFQKLKEALEQVTLRHEKVMSHEDAEDGDEEYLDMVEENYTDIMKLYRDYFTHQNKQRKEEERKEESFLFKAGRSTDEGISEADKLRFQLYGFGFNPQKETVKFDGSSPSQYKSFRVKWEYIDQKMTQMGRDGAEKLIELKKCLSGEARSYIIDLADDEENYLAALEILDEFYYDNAIFAGNAIAKLMDCPKMSHETSAKELYMALTRAEQTMKGLKVTDEQRGDLIFLAVIQSKLNNRLLNKWLDMKNKMKDSKHPLGTTANLDNLKSILRGEIKVKTQIDDIKGAESKKVSGKEFKKEERKPHDTKRFEKPANSTVRNTFATSTDQKKKTEKNGFPCTICDQTMHYPNQCRQLSSKTSSQIMQIIRDKKLCFRCFGKHRLEDCKFNKNCTKCDRRHSELIHDAIVAYNAKRVNTTQEIRKEQSEPKQIQTSAACKQENSQVILQSIVAWLKGPDGTKLKVRVFLDPGSDVCLIRRDISNELGLDGPESTLSLQVAGGVTLQESKEKEVCFKLESLDGRFITKTIEAITKEKIVEDFSPVTVDPNSYQHLKKLKFTEGYPRRTNAQIDILLGEPYYTDIITGAPIKGKENEPKAIPTQLGMVLAGSFQTEKSEQKKTYKVNFCRKPDLTRFWDLEHIGIMPEKENGLFTLEEEEAIKKMEEVTSYDKEKREWSTELLFKRNDERIQNNYKRAKAVMKSVEIAAKRRNHVTELNQAFDELIQNGFAEQVPDKESVDEKDEQIYYLQTHPVIRPEHESTKIRLVQNASSKDPETGKSLNDLLYQGPCLLNDFVQILIGFRHNRWAFTCDISKMFLRIKLKKGKNALRFIWRNCDENKKEIIYRMVVLAFGLNSSPFQAAWITRRHAELHRKQFELAFIAVMENMYVDDIATGKMKVNEAMKEAREILDLLKLAGMTACKWHSNNEEILKLIPDELKSKNEDIKVLGVQWNTKTDEIKFDFVPQMMRIEVETKRTFLQQTASIFDPLGILSPFVLKAKLLFQKTWQAELEWDSPLPKEMEIEWKRWKEQIPSLQEMNLKRCLVETNGKQIKKSEILAFGDASEYAYGCCVYLLTHYDDDSVSSSLVFAKSRVSPTTERKGERLTIVRLELLAALCTARAARFAAKALKIENIHCFTDSMITLGRIKRGHQNYKIWVARRLEEIGTLVRKEDWKFCPGKMNPSDLASRGCDARELLASELWWKGPEFIRRPKEQWPKEEHKNLEEKMRNEELTELKKEQKVMITVKTTNPIIELATRISDWSKFERIVCYIMRFGNKQQRKFKGEIKVPEMRKTKMILWKVSQEQHFYKELRNLEEGKEIEKDSKLNEWNVFMDENNIMRSRSRLILSTMLTYDEVNPIILANNCPIVEKYILNLHKVLGHSSANYLLALIRTHYKLLKSKREIKRIINKCLTKRCTKVIPLEQQMGPLPKERMDQLECFAHCATDLFGPMWVKHSCKHEDCVHTKETKVWGCIFTCLQSRAIHLEIVDDLSAEEFILALRRFVSRVGTPKSLFSDNGTNFTASAKELKKLFKNINWERVEKECLSKGIEWKFAVEAAPFTNGVAERMIQTVKKHVRIIIGSARLTKKHLEIVLKETELIVNNRPLSVVSPEEEELTPITPFQLMMGKTANFLPDPNWKKQIEHPGTFTKMWKLRQRLQNEFWKKWKKEYLMKQDIRRKWKVPSKTDLLHRIVIINDDNQPRNSWKLARIIECIPSKDGLIRTVILKTPQSTLRRPIQKISLLEEV